MTCVLGALAHVTRKHAGRQGQRRAHPVGLAELRGDVGSKQVPGAARAEPPAVHAILWVRPQQVAHRAVVRHLPCTTERKDINGFAAGWQSKHSLSVATPPCGTCNAARRVTLLRCRSRMEHQPFTALHFSEHGGSRHSPSVQRLQRRPKQSADGHPDTWRGVQQAPPEPPEPHPPPPTHLLLAIDGAYVIQGANGGAEAAVHRKDGTVNQSCRRGGGGARRTAGDAPPGSLHAAPPPSRNLRRLRQTCRSPTIRRAALLLALRGRNAQPADAANRHKTSFQLIIKIYDAKMATNVQAMSILFLA